MPQSTASPGRLDIAALETLRLVHELGSFTAAAEKLDVNQSAVSYTIAKLRAYFQDPLFVREGGRQVSTERCEHILQQVIEILEKLDDVAQPEEFDPAQSRAKVTIACNYYERILMIPKIVSELRKQAPHLEVEVVNALGDGHLRLLRREADVLVGPFARSESGFHSRRLYTEEYACFMDPRHPMAGRPLDVDSYLALNHVYINYGGGWKSAYVNEIEAAGHSLRPTITVPSPAGLASLLGQSDLVATMPSRLGRTMEGLVLNECPFRGPFDLSVVWTARKNDSAMHRWLREVIVETCRG
ncbi:LysR family transcriptional regulator [Thioclava sp. F42-5]|uniref:LysR family transcriptional regulator n=1 Tax=unclassified Thioclava TaxID=2621713 RepID=UPI000B53B879|nr:MULTISPECIES: LysR family transcriptional regulator [unclassified Thioclava]OWX99655.1 LysR family transcriptional regulator [Thioclava sp. F1Mire-8]OWY07372.1 LysR family transcriptional regulator [Thioclava sp. F42-5]